MRREFIYWYPVDLRVSGKDLIGNHLLFYLYIHVALFSEECWPKCIRCNGLLLLNGFKMSKRTGNYITINDAIDRYSSDGMRFALGDSGDQLDDANFTTENADSAVKKLWNFIDFSKKLVEMSEDSFVVREPHSYPEKVFESNIFECIIEALKSYDEMNFKDVLKHAYFNLINARDNYIKAVAILDEKWNKNLIYFCIESIVKLMSPITSHVCEYVWKFVLKHEGTVFDSGLPSVPENFDMTIIQSKTYVTRLLSNMRQVKKMYLKKK